MSYVVNYFCKKALRPIYLLGFWISHFCWLWTHPEHSSIFTVDLKNSSLIIFGWLSYLSHLRIKSTNKLITFVPRLSWIFSTARRVWILLFYRSTSQYLKTMLRMVCRKSCSIVSGFVIREENLFRPSLPFNINT